MNATLAPSAAPKHSLRVWSDGSRIYVEIPGAFGKAPYITSYPYDSRGMGLMLDLLGLHRIDYDYKGTLPSSYDKNPALLNGKPTTAEQRAQMEATLIKLGMLQPHQVRK